jgi:drug/metabolite transporter (DMT)-like permease
MVAACVGFTAIALARSQLTVPDGWTVWSALLVTGIFASAFAFVIQTWAQRRTSATRAALAFAAERCSRPSSATCSRAIGSARSAGAAAR